MNELETNRLVMEALQSKGLIESVEVSLNELATVLQGQEPAVTDEDQAIVMNFPAGNKSNLSARWEIAEPRKLYSSDNSTSAKSTSYSWVVRALERLTAHKSAPLQTISNRVLTTDSKPQVLWLYRIHGDNIESENIYRIIDSVNLQTIEHAIQLGDAEHWQKHMLAFNACSESEVVLMHRFVKHREQFFNTNKMLTAEEVITILGLRSKNARRTIATMIKCHELLAFKHDGKYLAPEFQFNHKAQVYPLLEKLIAKAVAKGIDHLELAMWLSQKRTFVTGFTRTTKDRRGQTIEALLNEINDTAQCNTQTFTGKPIDVIAQGNEALIDTLAEQWLEPQTMENMQGTIIHG